MKQDPFINNPELKRSAWLEFSVGRLVAMPIILGAIFLLVYVINNDSTWRPVAADLQQWSRYMFILIVIVWGGKRASESVIGEINEQTWDCQRLTLISPWVMSIGKLFGSTMYNWYGGGLCLLVYVWSSLQLPQLDISLKAGLNLVLISIFIHAIVIAMSLMGAGKNRNSGKIKGTFYFLVALVVGGYMASISGFMIDGPAGDVHWYFWRFGLLDFSLYSLLLFTAWGILGLYRNMRTELQFRNGPWVWYAFLGFLIVYSMGLVTEDLTNNEAEIIPLRYYTAYTITLSLCYYMLFSESKYIVDFRQLIDYFRTGRYKMLLHASPIWLLTLFAAAPLAILGLIFYIADPNFSFEGESAITFPLVLLGFLVRDICFVIYMNLADKSKRADLAALVYLLLFYALVPGILNALDLEGALMVFVPDPEASALAIVPIIMEVVIIGYLLSSRYKLRNRAIEKGTKPATIENLPPA